MATQKFTYKKLLELLHKLMYRITTVHLDMGGNNKYSLNHKAFPIVTELKYLLTQDIECDRCYVLGKLLQCKDELLVCYRLQKRPTEKLFKNLDKYNKMLKEIDNE
jgi:hypothetical protein